VTQCPAITIYSDSCAVATPPRRHGTNVAANIHNVMYETSSD